MSRIATSLFTLLLAGAASAVTSFTPTLGAPVQLTPGQTVDIELRIETTDLVGAVNAILFDSAGLTINTCTGINGVVTDMLCNALGGGSFQGIGSDFGVGIADLTALLSINVTANAIGGIVTLGTLAGDNSNFTRCPTNLTACLVIPDAILTAYANEGGTLVEVIPEPGTAALVSIGLVSLAILRRRTG